ncbi:MAG TPA: hypothetical protein VFP84_02655 [Kofleriaceae bacterium]|nr:hypothetical protein [Kofleriaceae bacterium]
MRQLERELAAPAGRHRGLERELAALANHLDAHQPEVGQGVAGDRAALRRRVDLGRVAIATTRDGRHSHLDHLDAHQPEAGRILCNGVFVLS